MLRVRRATEEDRIHVFKLAVQMHGETDFSHLQLNPEKLIHQLGVWIHQRVALVATDGDKLVGMMFATVAPPWWSDDNFLTEDFLYVLPEYRGGRAAYMLIRELVHWAKTAGIRHIRTGVSTGTGRGAERLYEHFGFSYTGANFVAHFQE
jgi:GNAT superfamily N-acetyltransferase